MTQFITLAGQKQVGKDTSANMIADMLELTNPGRVNVVHFADALKKACSIIFGIPLEDMETEEGKQKFTHVRWPRNHSFKPTWEGMDGRDAFEVSAYRPGNDHSKFMTVREILQFVGTDLFRNQMDANVWRESVFRQPWAEDDIVIIADARFPNEAEIARENGLLICVERNTGLVNDGHKSENALADYADYHYTVNNNGSFEELSMHLEAILVQRRLIV